MSLAQNIKIIIPTRGNRCTLEDLTTAPFMTMAPGHFPEPTFSEDNSPKPFSRMVGQSVYSRIESEVLQVAYNARLKKNNHMLLAPAFVPVDDVPKTFAIC